MMSSSLLSIFIVVILLNFAYAAPEGKPTLECPENEHYDKCELAVCLKNCDHMVQPPPCPLISADCFLPACVCNEGYLRKDGVCVPFRKCGVPVPWWMNSS